jgi:hypothetical protein
MNGLLQRVRGIAEHLISPRKLDESQHAKAHRRDQPPTRLLHYERERAERLSADAPSRRISGAFGVWPATIAFAHGGSDAQCRRDRCWSSVPILSGRLGRTTHRDSGSEPTIVARPTKLVHDQQPIRGRA